MCPCTLGQQENEKVRQGLGTEALGIMSAAGCSLLQWSPKITAKVPEICQAIQHPQSNRGVIAQSSPVDDK